MGGQQGGLMGMMLPLAMFAAIFYFMIIRPQKKKQKAHEDMLASISKGDTVITAGGFFGIVREILEDSYIIELDEGVKTRILKSSISMKKSDGNTTAPQPKKKKSKKLETAPAESVAAEKPESQESAASEPVVEEQPEKTVVEAQAPETTGCDTSEPKKEG